jgi:hypothetical protein
MLPNVAESEAMPHQSTPLHSAPAPWLRTLAVLPLVLAASMAAAQQNPADFPLASVGYLNEELPRMEAAIAAKDRNFFQGAMSRTVDFSDRWGFKAKANPDLAKYPMCTDAVMDYVIVGMCKLNPVGDECEPGLAPRFDANLRRCRELAAQK